MKVAFVTGSWPPVQCGIGDYTYHLAANLLRVDSSLSIDVVTRGPTRSDHLPARLAFRPVSGWGIGELPRLVELLRDAEADLIHIQYPAKGYGWGLAPNLLPVITRLSQVSMPIVVTLHEFTIAHPLRKVSELFLALCAQRVVVCDNREFRSIKRLARVRGSEPVLIPIASNIPDYPVGNNRERTGDVLLCYFGLISKSKDPVLLLRVLRELRREGLPVCLRFIGGIEPKTMRAIQTIAIEHEVSDAIDFTGFCSPEEVARHLATSDAVVLPFQDGVSLRRTSFVAAMRQGVPVVTTRTCSYVPDGLEDGKNVLLVEPGDVRGFTSAVRRILASPSLQMTLGEGARRWAEGFSWDAIAAAHIALYRQVTNCG